MLTVEVLVQEIESLTSLTFNPRLLGGIAVVMFGITTAFVLFAATAVSQVEFLKRLDFSKPNYSKSNFE